MIHRHGFNNYIVFNMMDRLIKSRLNWVKLHFEYKDGISLTIMRLRHNPARLSIMI